MRNKNMTKQELLHSLGEALKTEESAIPLYTGHIVSTLSLSNFNDDEQKLISETLQTLNVESTQHSVILHQLIDKVQSEDKNVY